MKKILLFFVSLFLGIGFLIWTVQHVGVRQIQEAFLSFGWWQGAVILLLTFLIIFSGIWKWKIILKSQGYNLPWQNLINPYLAGFCLSYLFPIFLFGGELFRGHILKEKFAIPQEKAMASVAIERILENTVFLAMIFLGLSFFFIEIGLPPKNLAIILVSFLAFFGLITGFFYFRTFRGKSVVRFFAESFSQRKMFRRVLLGAEKEFFKFFNLRQKAMWHCFGLTLLKIGIIWLRCWLLIIFLGGKIGFLFSLPILSFYLFSVFIPIPANLGSHEIAQTFSFAGLGLGANLAFAFTMIQRGADLTVAFAGMILLFGWGLNLLKIALFKIIENGANHQE